MVLRELLAVFGVQFEGGPQLERASLNIDGLSESLGALGAAFAGNQLFRAAASLIDEMSQFGDELDETSQQLGVSANELLEWRTAAAFAGASTQQLTAAMAALTRNAAAAARGGQAQARIFNQLGVEVRDSSGNLRSASDLMADVGAAIGGLGSESEKVAVSMQLFGNSGRRLLPLFNEGAEGIANARAEAAQLFGDISGFTGDAAEFRDVLDRWDLVLQAIKIRLVVDVLPVLTRFFEWARGMVTQLTQLTDGSHIFQVALAALTATAAILGLVLLAPFAETLIVVGLVAAAIGIVVLVVDDLISLFTGGRSVIGQFLDQMFGLGTAKALVTGVNEAVEGFIEFATEAYETARQWLTYTIEFAQQAGAYLTEMYGPAFDAFMNFAGAMRNLLSALGEFFVTVFSNAWRIVSNMMTSGIQQLLGIAQRVASTLGIDTSDLQELQASMAGVTTGIFDSAAAGVNTIAGTVQQATQMVQQEQQIQLNVNGAGDPTTVADAVMARLRETEARGLRAARAALVPTAED